MEINANIKTSKGNIKLILFADKVPMTVSNFVNLSLRGYYRQSPFHRVIPNFMIQTGTQQDLGITSPGYEFDDECLPELLHDKPGILSMAKPNRPNSNGSQFFITHVPTPWLDGVHSVFGEITKIEDMEIVNGVNQGDVIESIKISGDIQGLYKKNKNMINDWNNILDQNFPNLSQPDYNH